MIIIIKRSRYKYTDTAVYISINISINILVTAVNSKVRRYQNWNIFVTLLSH
jgi:hypothetical protein